MPDWTASMQQTFEYYIVDPKSWRDIKRLENVKSCTISRDSDADTLGSATFELSEAIGECYVRVYLITIQNGIQERFPLGTYLLQTPESSFDGKRNSISVDAYTPLLELKENMPPVGYYIPKGQNAMKYVYTLTHEHVRAPVVEAESSTTLFYDFVADTSDTWLTFLTDLATYSKHKFDLDEMGRVLFAPHQDSASLQPIWEYDDGNSSILYPDLTYKHDMYGVPNAIEVVYSDGDNHYYTKIVNDDPNSPISTVNRGREIMERESNPSLVGDPTDNKIKAYAEQKLRDLSSLEYTVSYTHGYCPVRVGDCVRFNYARPGLNGIKAKVISQTIKCQPGVPVSEKAVFTTKLWKG